MTDDPWIERTPLLDDEVFDLPDSLSLDDCRLATGRAPEPFEDEDR